MTPAVSVWYDPSSKANQWYYAVRGGDAKIYYQGPDTKGEWQVVDSNSYSISGVSMDIGQDGSIVISYVNKDGAVCSYSRKPGGGAWSWANHGGKVN